MQWSDILSQQPTLAEIATDKLIKPGVLLVGTLRHDGTPRISAVEPLVMEGQLWLSMMGTSMKTRDLRRDRRIVLNSIVTDPQATELKVRGTVHPHDEPATQQHYATTVAAALGWEPVVGHFALFTIDIDDFTYIGYDPDTGGQHVARWPPSVEYVRPATTPTSLGTPQPVRRLLH
ncbi:MAG: pyridoxamine 5'-phosphate oxidase family protein [Acidimicrobiaceae bacterium]|nr:pyridoxamine 5'-phosphate oxidase family protein [Acidimicrobiaceae bacterium]